MTLILGSGRGLTSYTRWLTTSACNPALLQLDVVFENKQSSGTGDRLSYAVTFRPAPNPSLLLFLAGALTEWALHLTSWSVQREDSVFSATSGKAGAASGVDLAIRCTTEPPEHYSRKALPGG